MLSRTSTAWSPWYVIPANQRWYTYAAVTSVLVRELKSLHTDFPSLDDAAQRKLQEARVELLRERSV
jgi:hypothetical protein